MQSTAKRVSPAGVFAQPTGDAIWRGPKQEDALAHLLARRCIKVLIGTPSSGKSTVLRLFARHAEDTIVLPCAGPQTSALGVLSTLLTGAGLSLWTLSENEQRNLLTVFVEQRSFNGTRIAICVDNVSDFSADAWAEIERLTYLRFAGQPMIDLIVAATEKEVTSPVLDRFLRESNTCRVEAVHFLSPPDGQDLESYIRWRLAMSGIQSTFTSEACAAIATKASGRFNTVNLICQVLLWKRAFDQPEPIDEEAVCAAVAKLTALKDSDSRCRAQKLRELERDSAQGADSEAAGRLIVYQNGRELRELPLRGSIVIGRCPGNDLQLKSRVISRHHVAITATVDGCYFISDLNSTNGVLVNGKLVRRSPLHDGDVIDLCEFRIRVDLSDGTGVVHKLETSMSTDDDDTDALPAPDLHAEEERMAGSR